MNVYLICGKAGSGKNKVAEILASLKEDSVITGFSKYIKNFCYELTDWDGNDNDKPREFLQSMGDILRKIDNNFLAKRMTEDLEVYKKYGIKNVIICDTRLKSEIDYMKKNKNINIVTIKVNSLGSTRFLTEEEKNHRTEIELDTYDKFDYVIENNYDNTLTEQLEEMLKEEK